MTHRQSIIRFRGWRAMFALLLAATAALAQSDDLVEAGKLKAGLKLFAAREVDVLELQPLVPTLELRPLRPLIEWTLHDG